MNKTAVSRWSLFVTLGIIIVATVVAVLSLLASYTYLETKKKILSEMKASSREVVVALEKNVSDLIQSYQINEYEKLVFTEMERNENLAIIVEDYNMGKVIGERAYISGKIRNSGNKIVDYDRQDLSQKQQLAASFYSEKYDVTNKQGNVIGAISIYKSGEMVRKKLNEIIVGSLINTLVISLILILILFIAIQQIILRPIADIASAISNTDEGGVPLHSVPQRGANEVVSLAKTMNSMINTIKQSRLQMNQQHKELIAREDQLRTLSMATEQSPVSIVICDPLNVVDYVNPQFEKTSGYSKYEVTGQTIESLLEKSMYKEDNPERMLRGLKQLLDSGNKWIGELELLDKTGNKHVLRLSVSSILSSLSEVMHYIYVAEDITEIKHNEEILRNSQKMDAVGQLTGGIAHDFNNLLGIIMGNLELLKMTITDDTKALERIDNALAGTERGAQLTRKLLNFSRHNQQEMKVVYINQNIENLHELISKAVTAIIKVEISLGTDLWPVEIEIGDLEDAILNLALNARDAMPDGGRLVIETANKYLDANYVKQNPQANVGDYVVVSVSDTGSGISKELQKKIFDPFFSTKEVGKGTGLGLSMVYGFVQRSGGHIQLYSEEGKGTTFNMYLPRAKENNEVSMQEKQHERTHGSELILVVDDEPSMAELAEEYLHNLGYRTMSAHSADEALKVVSDNDIDLLFSDIVMAGMNGYELACEVNKLKPSIKILLTSGFTEKIAGFEKDEKDYHHQLLEGMLNKPYTYNELGEAVRKVLDEERPV